MITYFGSKSRIGSWIVDYYPRDMEILVEPFSGAFWCFFNMDLEKFKNLHTVVYNDYNPLNANLFRCITQHERFYEELIKHPCQEYRITNTSPDYNERFIRYQKEVFDSNLVLTSEPNFDIGAKYAYVISQTFSGISSSTTKFVDLKGKYRSKFLSFVDKFKKQEYIDHIKKISFVENMDFAEVIDKYDSPTTFLYLDPPYKERETKYSNHNFVSDTHERLMNTLKSVKGKWCLSYYDFPELSEWYPKDKYKWVSKDYKKASGASRGKKQSTGTELLIMNYEYFPVTEVKVKRSERKLKVVWTPEVNQEDIAFRETNSPTIEESDDFYDYLSE